MKNIICTAHPYNGTACNKKAIRYYYYNNTINICIFAACSKHIEAVYSKYTNEISEEKYKKIAVMLSLLK